MCTVRSVVLWVLVTNLSLGCGDNTAAPPDAGIDALSPPALPRDKDDATLAVQRAACDFGTGAWPAETIGKEYPLGDDIPIDHILVIMQENRSFDNYFGQLVAQGYYQGGDFTATGDGLMHHDQVDVPPAGWELPDGSGGAVAPHPDTNFCFGVNHGWNDMHQDWDDGANDGFVINNNPNGARSMSYVDDSIIPFYYALADKFAIGDRYFASVLTSTWPNRYFVMAATSFGIGDNSFNKDDTEETPAAQVFSLLEASGHTWADYTDGPSQVEFFHWFGYLRDTFFHYHNVKCELMSDIDNDTLPDVAFIMGSEVGETSDEGPSALPGIGGALVEEIVRRLMTSPEWGRSVVFITYDENGGMADHVPPAAACEPDDLAPHEKDGSPLPGKFDHTGFRVPFIVVSPYAKPHYVSHTVYDHTSITRFIEARFGLPAMTARDANAAVPFDMFDFDKPAYMTPPTITAHTTVDPDVLSRCGQVMAPIGCQ